MLALSFFAFGNTTAQEIIKEETVKDTVKPVKPQGRIKVDGVVAVVDCAFRTVARICPPPTLRTDARADCRRALPARF